jgi:hypothetical protein
MRFTMVTEKISSILKDSQPLSALVAATCKPLPDIDNKSFGSHFDTFANSRVVLIGDARYGSFSKPGNADQLIVKAMGRRNSTALVQQLPNDSYRSMAST